MYLNINLSIHVCKCPYTCVHGYKHTHEYAHTHNHPFRYIFFSEGVCKTPMGVYFQTANAVFLIKICMLSKNKTKPVTLRTSSQRGCRWREKNTHPTNSYGAATSTTRHGARPWDRETNNSKGFWSRSGTKMSMAGYNTTQMQWVEKQVKGNHPRPQKVEPITGVSSSSMGRDVLEGREFEVTSTCPEVWDPKVSPQFFPCVILLQPDRGWGRAQGPDTDRNPFPAPASLEPGYFRSQTTNGHF